MKRRNLRVQHLGIMVRVPAWIVRRHRFTPDDLLRQPLPYVEER